MTYVINQGMAMYWGTSRWTAMEIMEAYSVARQFNMIPPVCEQAEYHMFQREKVEVQLPELYHKIGRCGRHDVVSPRLRHHHGESYQWLKDKIVSEDGRKQQAKLKELGHIAEKLGCTLPQLAVAWCLRNEGVSSVLLGTSNPEQLTENLGAIQVLPKMTSHVVSEIDHILGNRPYTSEDGQQAVLGGRTQVKSALLSTAPADCAFASIRSVERTSSSEPIGETPVSSLPVY
ncbi:hypothetical protein Z043_124588 [Scleropages formosus]|uniref:NADP-dependent oxidoreductase domain-containing protein n=1 Tax=Scleropages formosus TaxID=113540 RepID=A0A0P7XXK9_SCLFO|nr:hypothetical protein Z043_124588 [Scleropages formosus]